MSFSHPGHILMMFESDKTIMFKIHLFFFSGWLCSNFFFFGDILCFCPYSTPPLSYHPLPLYLSLIFLHPWLPPQHHTLLSLSPLTSAPLLPSPVSSCILKCLFPVVAKLYGQAVENAAESGRLDLPIVDRVAIETDAIVEGPLSSKASGAEVIHINSADAVFMEVDNLKIEGRERERTVWERVCLWEKLGWK